jgi:cell wall-associated NlpC family hydrolase
MSVAPLDRRLHAFRSDLADIRLKGRVEASRFAEGTLKRVVASAVPLRPVPRADSSLDSELLRGEAVRVFDETGEGWSWIQNESDGYVGYVPAEALADLDPAPTHRVTALRTFVYPGPDMKLPAVATLSLHASLTLDGAVETRGTRFRLLANGEGAVIASHVTARDAPPATDFVAVAERFLETPYLWGGRTSVGLDCSALIQLSLQAVGQPAPRDTDMQEHVLGGLVEGGVDAPLRRGDIVFWKGHVGIMVTATHMVHASGHHMMVVIEPLAEAASRIADAAGPVTSVRRL